MTPTPNAFTQTPMTDLGAFRAGVEGLPGDVASLARAVHGLLVHGECLDLYGLDAAAFGPTDRSTLPAHERLGRLAARGALDLARGRPPAGREVGTCRDFALLLTAFLQAHGAEARCRCGFASYLGPGWEDHWLCEYRLSGAAAWRVADAQLGDLQRGAWNIAFDPLDVPRDAFLTAGEAWTLCRTGRSDPGLYGNGGTRGLWFMAVDVVRDHLSLNGRETSDWDRWREAAAEQRRLTEDQLSRLDALARRPDAPAAVPLVPPWLDAPPAAGTA